MYIQKVPGDVAHLPELREKIDNTTKNAGDYGFLFRKIKIIPREMYQ